MTPKEAYEERKAIRKARMEKVTSSHEEKDLEMMEYVDRIATAFERIASALERK